MENGIFFSFLRVSNLLSFEKSEKVDFNGGKKKMKSTQRNRKKKLSRKVSKTQSKDQSSRYLAMEH
jgi:hypothetical protein